MPKPNTRNINVILLIAGKGDRLKEVTTNPKCLINIQERTLIDRILDQISLFENKLAKIILVTGYKSEKILNQISKHKLFPLCHIVVNPNYELGSIISLNLTKELTNKYNFIMDGDVVCESSLISLMFNSHQENLILIDSKSENTGEEILVGASDKKVISVKRGLIGKFTNYGESIGFMKLNKSSCLKLFGIIDRKISSGFNKLGYEDILDDLVQLIEMSFIYVEDKIWIEIDFPEDYRKANKLNIS